MIVTRLPTATLMADGVTTPPLAIVIVVVSTGVVLVGDVGDELPLLQLIVNRTAVAPSVAMMVERIFMRSFHTTDMAKVLRLLQRSARLCALAVSCL